MWIKLGFKKKNVGAVCRPKITVVENKMHFMDVMGYMWLWSCSVLLMLMFVSDLAVYGMCAWQVIMGLCHWCVHVFCSVDVCCVSLWGCHGGVYMSFALWMFVVCHYGAVMVVCTCLLLCGCLLCHCGAVSWWCVHVFCSVNVCCVSLWGCGGVYMSFALWMFVVSLWGCHGSIYVFCSVDVCCVTLWGCVGVYMSFALWMFVVSLWGCHGGVYMSFALWMFVVCQCGIIVAWMSLALGTLVVCHYGAVMVVCTCLFLCGCLLCVIVGLSCWYVHVFFSVDVCCVSLWGCVMLVCTCLLLCERLLCVNVGPSWCVSSIGHVGCVSWGCHGGVYMSFALWTFVSLWDCVMVCMSLALCVLIVCYYGTVPVVCTCLLFCGCLL